MECKRLMRENIFKGLLPALCRFLQCFSWTKTISWQNLETKFLKDKFFCRQEGRSGTRQRQTEFNQGQGQLYNQGFQSQKSVAEKQPPEKQHNNINLGGGKEEKLGVGGRGVEGEHRGGEGGPWQQRGRGWWGGRPRRWSLTRPRRWSLTTSSSRK